MVLSVRRKDTLARTWWERFSAWMTSVLEGDKGKGTVASLDGIRAIACLAVITFHIGLKSHVWDIHSFGHLTISILMAGDSGVTLFFVLSGLLLFMPYVKSLLFESAWPSTLQFYARRALRILPGYYVSLFLLILLSSPQYLRADHLKDLGLFLSLFMDSSAKTYQQINGPFWTLAVEWQFYLLLPFIALIMRGIVQRGSLQRRVYALVICLLGVVAWGIFSRWAGFFITSHPSLTAGLPYLLVRIPLFFLFGTGGGGSHGKFLEDFAIGMLVSLCYILGRNVPQDGRFNRMMSRCSQWLWGAGILWLVLMALWEGNGPHPLGGRLGALLTDSYDVWHELGLSLGFACVILAVLFGGLELKRLFEWSPLRWIGLISYSLYIWHLPFILFYMLYVLPYVQHARPSTNYALYWFWVLLTAFPFSFLFFIIIERPWMRLSDRWLRGRGMKQQHSQATSS